MKKNLKIKVKVAVETTNSRKQRIRFNDKEETNRVQLNFTSSYNYIKNSNFLYKISKDVVKSIPKIGPVFVML